MDEFDIYVNVERPSGNPGKRKTKAKCSENLYLDKPKTHTREPSKTGPAVSVTGDTKPVKKSSYGAAAVILGLLCLLLLIGLITLIFLFTKIKSEKELEMALLQTSYNNLTEQRDQLQTSYNNLTEQRDQLQTSYNNLTEQRDQLQTSYNNLTEQKHQLQTSYNQVATEKGQLQEKVEALIKERNNRQRSFEDTQDWTYFRGSLYHVSSIQKTWQESRDDCLQKGADLLIINSREEQDFANQMKKYMWIGLTDLDREGTWKWVDGTPMTQSYWIYQEPNGETRENCADIKTESGTNTWNDEACSLSLFWVCEKKASS